MEMRICAAVAGNQPKTVRMVIKNQNALYSPACRIGCGQPAYFFDDEDLPHLAPLSIRRRALNQIRLTTGKWPGEWRWKRHHPIAKAFPFHEAPYDWPSHRRHSACVGFCGATYEVMLAASFEIETGPAKAGPWTFSSLSTNLLKLCRYLSTRSETAPPKLEVSFKVMQVL